MFNYAIVFKNEEYCSSALLGQLFMSYYETILCKWTLLYLEKGNEHGNREAE